MTSSFVQWWWYGQKNVFWSKIYFGAFANSLIFNHLTSNFPQYFFDIFLIRIRQKKSRKFFNDVMTEWYCNVLTGGNMRRKKIPRNWSDITFRKSQKISGQTRSGFRNIQQSIQPRPPPPPPPPPSLGRVNKNLTCEPKTVQWTFL